MEFSTADDVLLLLGWIPFPLLFLRVNESFVADLAQNTLYEMVSKKEVPHQSSIFDLQTV